MERKEHVITSVWTVNIESGLTIPFSTNENSSSSKNGDWLTTASQMTFSSLLTCPLFLFSVFRPLPSIFLFVIHARVINRNEKEKRISHTISHFFNSDSLSFPFVFPHFSDLNDRKWGEREEKPANQNNGRHSFHSPTLDTIDSQYLKVLKLHFFFWYTLLSMNKLRHRWSRINHSILVYGLTIEIDDWRMFKSFHVPAEKSTLLSILHFL